MGEAELKKAKLADTMDTIPPIVDWETPANVLVPLIRYSKCILVSKRAKVVGIITASDTLKMME
jgi:predicted transcriptional regulator